MGSRAEIEIARGKLREAQEALRIAREETEGWKRAARQLARVAVQTIPATPPPPVHPVRAAIARMTRVSEFRVPPDYLSEPPTT